MTDAISIRLTPTQMSVILPGLGFIVKAGASRKTKGAIHYQYPFGIYPLPPEFDRGTFHPELMNVFEDLCRKLRKKQGCGGRIQVGAIELRATMFAVRVTKGLSRVHIRSLRRHLSSATRESKKRLAEILDQARQDSARQHSRAHRTIRSLERLSKRANRLLQKRTTEVEYDALVRAWAEHLRWMRLHLVYFKPLPPIVRSKRRRQKVLDLFTEMAIRGLMNEGHAPPGPRELRRVIRLYVRSSNRGREGRDSVPEMLRYPNHLGNTWFLAQWVISRTKEKNGK